MIDRMFDNRIKIGVTQGDTNGVGWEVILKALANPMVVELCTPIIYGNRKAAEFYTSLIDMEDMEPIKYFYCSSAEEARYGAINFVDVGEKELKIEPGRLQRLLQRPLWLHLRLRQETLRMVRSMQW